MTWGENYAFVAWGVLRYRLTGAAVNIEGGSEGRRGRGWGV